MDWFSLILIVSGLALFEIIISIDNAIINAEVLSTMTEKGKKWFLFWGILIAVFLVRGLLPWLILWISTPSLGFLGSFTASFSSDPSVVKAIQESAPVLLIGGGTFLVFLFFHWLFLEKKYYGLIGEEFIQQQGVWFFAVASVLLVTIVWMAIKHNPTDGSWRRYRFERFFYKPWLQGKCRACGKKNDSECFNHVGHQQNILS